MIFRIFGGLPTSVLQMGATRICLSRPHRSRSAASPDGLERMPFETTPSRGARYPDEPLPGGTAARSKYLRTYQRSRYPEDSYPDKPLPGGTATRSKYLRTHQRSRYPEEQLPGGTATRSKNVLSRNVRGERPTRTNSYPELPGGTAAREQLPGVTRSNTLGAKPLNGYPEQDLPG